MAASKSVTVYWREN